MKATPFLIVCILIYSATVTAQLNKFDQPGPFTDKHILYEYKKSNWDGTHSSSVFLYVGDSNRLESFKCSEGDKVATLVTAIIDWTTFSVAEF